MAAVSLDSNLRWTTNDPEITFDFSYEKKREGTTQYYKITVSCDPLTQPSYFEFAINLELKLDGKRVASRVLKEESTSYKNWSSAITFTTEWLSVSNKTDGTTELAIRLYSNYRDATYTYSLPVDSAVSTIAASDANIESTSTISITRYNSKYTTTVAYKADGQSSYTTIWTKQKYSSYGWTVPTSLYSLIPSAKSLNVTLRCQTYNGSTLIGEETCTMEAKTSASKCRPTVSVNAVDSNTNTVALTGSNKRIIKGFSDIQVTTTATAKNSATISSVSVTCGSEKKTGTSVTFSDAESVTIEATAKDSRGYSTSASASGMTLIDYISPTVVAEAERASPTSDNVKVSVKGKWFNGTFGSITNTLRVEVRYKPKSQANYTDSDLYKEITVTKSGNNYSGSITLSGLVYTQAYNLRIRVRDAVHTYDEAIAAPIHKGIELSKGVPVFDWGEADFRFNVPIYSGGVNFTHIYQTESGAGCLGQGDSGTLKNLTDYHRLYYVRPTISDGVNPANVYIPCGRLGDRLIGVGGFPHTNGRMDLFSVQLLLSGNTVTVEHCGYWNTESQVFGQRKVHGIFAVL